MSSINNYRLTLLEHCENITQIDDVVISPHIREGYKVNTLYTQILKS